MQGLFGWYESCRTGDIYRSKCRNIECCLLHKTGSTSNWGFRVRSGLTIKADTELDERGIRLVHGTEQIVENVVGNVAWDSIALHDIYLDLLQYNYTHDFEIHDFEIHNAATDNSESRYRTNLDAPTWKLCIFMHGHVICWSSSSSISWSSWSSWSCPSWSSETFSLDVDS